MLRQNLISDNAIENIRTYALEHKLPTSCKVYSLPNGIIAGFRLGRYDKLEWHLFSENGKPISHVVFNSANKAAVALSLGLTSINHSAVLDLVMKAGDK